MLFSFIENYVTGKVTISLITILQDILTHFIIEEADSLWRLIGVHPSHHKILLGLSASLIPFSSVLSLPFGRCRA